MIVLADISYSIIFSIADNPDNDDSVEMEL
jgi:hypothetical protein